MSQAVSLKRHIGDMKTIALAIAFVILGIASEEGSVGAQVKGVDWKYYGGTGEGAAGEYLFYNADDLNRRPDGHIEVWTKALPQKATLKALDTMGDKNELMKAAVIKRLQSYKPPFMSVVALDEERESSLISMEVIADSGDVKTTSQIMFEVDCTGRVIRTLSVIREIHSKIKFTNEPSEWMHTNPESNGAALLKLVCSKS